MTEAKTNKVIEESYEILPEPSYNRALFVCDNSLNGVSFGTLKSNEQNLIFYIFVKIRDRGHEPVTFTPEEIAMTYKKRLSLKELCTYVTSLREHFFKLDFRSVSKNEKGEIQETYINFFKSFTITKNEKNELINLKVEVNENFEYLVNRLKANFTAFELANLLVLDSKYAKNLFRLLKQYKFKGQANFNWEEFKSLMGIPNTATFTTTRIKNKVLIPAIEEIRSCKPECVFNKKFIGSKNPPLQNLTFTLFKKDNTKKTSPVSSIQFNWTPEITANSISTNLIANIDPNRIYPVEEVNRLLQEAQKNGTEVYNETLRLLEKSMMPSAAL
jgi:hypothetical protein